jgi:hypothetical protein
MLPEIDRVVNGTPLRIIEENATSSNLALPIYFVRYASTAPITLNGPQVVDGYLTVSGTIVLARLQADPNDNGIWRAQGTGTPWVKISDDKPAIVVVLSGSTLQGYTLWTDNGINWYDPRTSAHSIHGFPIQPDPPPGDYNILEYYGGLWKYTDVVWPIPPIDYVTTVNPSGVDTQPNGTQTIDGIIPTVGDTPPTVLIAAGDLYDGIWAYQEGAADWVLIDRYSTFAAKGYPVTILRGQTQAGTQWLFDGGVTWGTGWLRFPLDAAIDIVSTAGIGLGPIVTATPWFIPLNLGGNAYNFGSTAPGVGTPGVNTDLLYTSGANDLQVRFDGIYQISAMLAMNVPAGFVGQVHFGVYVNGILAKVLAAPTLNSPGAALDYAFTGSAAIVVRTTDTVTIGFTHLVAGPPIAFGACATTNAFEVSASLIRRI